MSNKIKNQIIKENKLYFSKCKINLSNNIQDLPVMYSIPQMLKDSISFYFTISGQTCSMKPLAKDIN